MRYEFSSIGGSSRNATRQEGCCAASFGTWGSLNLGFRILRKGWQKAP